MYVAVPRTGRLLLALGSAACSAIDGDQVGERSVNIEDIVSVLIDPTRPPWQQPKPCAVCRADFIPADPRQECCPQHQRQLIDAVRASLQKTGGRDE
jgi:hypothetical protein